MSYRLGIDLGTTFSAAAVSRGGTTAMVSLGTRQPEIPSVVAVLEEGTLVGDAAERRALEDPQSIAREFKRRLGDPTPLIVAGSPWSPEALLGRLLAQIIEHVKEAEGGAPPDVVVTHPANWGQFKLDRLQQAILIAGCNNGTTLPEPVAAAQHYAHQGSVQPGQTTVVFDFGGGTFDAAVLQSTADTFEIRGEPQGLEQLGGIDLDQAVLAHVFKHAEINPSDIEDTPTNRRSMARLRLDCREAKEALSSDTTAIIPVMLPGNHSDVRITRTEFEAMIREPVSDAIGVVELAIQRAGLATNDVDSVLLVGGSSRIPVVSQLISEKLGLPILTDAHPKHAVAMGAAAGPVRNAAQATEPAPPAKPASIIETVGTSGTARETSQPAPETPETENVSGPDHQKPTNRRPLVLGAVALIFAAAAIGAFALRPTNKAEPGGTATTFNAADATTWSTEELGDELGLSEASFEPGSASMNPELAAILDGAALVLIEHDLTIEVAVHTFAGTADFVNQGLSEIRANTVMVYLIEQGVPAANLTDVGYGETVPLVDDDTPEGHAQNSRIEFVVSPEPADN